MLDQIDNISMLTKQPSQIYILKQQKYQIEFLLLLLQEIRKNPLKCRSWKQDNLYIVGKALMS